MRLRNFISEAIAEIQASRMNAFAPLSIAIGDTPRRRRRDRDNFKTKPVNKPCHFSTEPAPFRYDQRFRDRSS